MAGDVIGETRDPAGKRVVVPAGLWRDKILRDHPELAPHLDDVLRAIAEPDQIHNDPAYEQELARVISAFGNRKDPRSWSE